MWLCRREADVFVGEWGMLNRGEEALLEFGYATLLVLADNLQGLEKNFNDLLCPVLKGFVTGKARYPRYFEDFQFLDEKDASKMLSEIVSRGADEKLPLLYILIDDTTISRINC